MVQLFIMVFLMFRLQEYQNGISSSIIKFRDLFLFGSLIFCFGTIGVFRDGGDNVTFTTVLRLSEPYWYIAYEESTHEFNQVFQGYTK